MRKTSIIGIAGMAAMFSLTITSTTHAADPAIKCESGKLKEAGKYASCRMKAESKAVKKGELPDYTKCESKFSDKWDKTETKAGGECPSNGDEAAVEAAITSCMGDVAAGLAPWVCPGAREVGGACWFYGALGADCDETCVGAGLSYDSATDTFAGASAPDSTGCEAVAAAVAPIVALADPVDVGCISGLGCSYDSFYDDIARCTSPATTSDASHVNVRRICACAP